MTVRAIWAQASTGAIGADGEMLWHLPEDLAYFKRATVGAPVVMGRRTWRSFPPQWRPLPGRLNIVLTRDDSFHDDGAVVVHSVEDALRAARDEADDVWVIGGGEVYRQTMPVLDELWVTEVDVTVDGDAYAPPIGAEWQVASADPADGWHVSRTGTRYRYLVYRRAAAG